MLTKIDMLRFATLNSDQSVVKADLSECHAFSVVLSRFLSTLADYYGGRRAPGVSQKVHEIVKHESWQKLYCFDHRQWVPGAFRPIFTIKDVGMLEIDQLFEDGEAASVWSFITNLFLAIPGGSENVEIVTKLWDEVLTKVAASTGEGEFLQRLEALCKNACPFLNTAAAARQLKKQNSAASDGSEDLSWLFDGPSSPQPRKQDPQVQRDSEMPRNVIANLLIIGAAVFYRLCGTEALQAAHAVQSSPESPAMVRAVFGAQLFIPVWERSKAWLAAAQALEKAFREERPKLDGVKSLHAALEQQASQIAAATDVDARCKASSGVLELDDRLAQFCSSHQTLTNDHPAEHMKPEAAEELARLDNLAGASLRLILQHAAVSLVSIVKMTAPDYAGISSGELFLGACLSAVELLEEYKKKFVAFADGLSRAGLLLPAHPSLEFRHCKEFAERVLTLRLEHLRSMPDVDKNMKELAFKFKRLNELVMSPHSLWLRMPADSEAPQRRSAWTESPLLPMLDWDYMMKSLKANEELRAAKVQHQRNPAKVQHQRNQRPSFVRHAQRFLRIPFLFSTH